MVLNRSLVSGMASRGMTVSVRCTIEVTSFSCSASHSCYRFIHNRLPYTNNKPIIYIYKAIFQVPLDIFSNDVYSVVTSNGKGVESLDTLNERIKEVRKKLGLSQKDFAQKVGISQRSVSWGEQPGNNVPDSTIKSLCIVFRINETWLRTGDGDMFIEPDTFSLDQYAKERGASELELAIAKAYFDLPQDVRSQMLAKLKSLLNGEAEVAAELAPVLPSAAGQGPDKPPDNLEGLATEELGSALRRAAI